MLLFTSLTSVFIQAEPNVQEPNVLIPVGPTKRRWTIPKWMAKPCSNQVNRRSNSIYGGNTNLFCKEVWMLRMFLQYMFLICNPWLYTKYTQLSQNYDLSSKMTNPNHPPKIWSVGSSSLVLSWRASKDWFAFPKTRSLYRRMYT